MKQCPPIRHLPPQVVIEIDNECQEFETWESYKKHCNKVRNYLRTLNQDSRYEIEQIPIEYKHDAVRMIIEEGFARLVNNNSEFYITNPNMI